MNKVLLGASDLQVTPICLGTMTFGEQVNEALAHTILDRSLERGVNFIDTDDDAGGGDRRAGTHVGWWTGRHRDARRHARLQCDSLHAGTRLHAGIIVMGAAAGGRAVVGRAHCGTAVGAEPSGVAAIGTAVRADDVDPAARVACAAG